MLKIVVGEELWLKFLLWKNNPPILLLHGGFVDAGMWTFQIQDLEKEIKDIAQGRKNEECN